MTSVGAWQMTSADAVVDDVAMTWQMTSPRADVSIGTLARAGAWRRVEGPDGAWRRVGRVINRSETFSGAWGRVQSPMTLNLPRLCRSARDDLCGRFKTAIGAMFVTVMRAAVVCAV